MPDREVPAALGYRLPAQWEPHAATWVAWPHNRRTWPGNFECIPAVWAELVRTVARFEPVHVLASGGEVIEQARAMLAGTAGVTFHEISTNDAWIRDYGPTFLAGPPEKPKALVDWQYNAWGNRYEPFDLDNAAGAQIARSTGRRRFCPGMILEGGAIDANGRGTVLAGRRCLVNENRNPELRAADIERYLADYLAAPHVLWLDGTIAGDDTDGHVDQVARFTGPSTVAAVRQSDPQEANHAPLEANYARLARMTDQDGRPLKIVSLPMPRPLYHDGLRLPASYANFYVANGLVVVPQFSDPADAEACKILSQLFPNRTVRGLPAVDLIWGLGAYHCATQQEPLCP